MDKNKFPYYTKFDVKANILKPSEDIVREAHASLSNLKGVFPSDLDPETDPDLLYIVANLAVAGVLNLNDDGISIDESLAIYKKFEKKQVNIEHDRERTVGFIFKSGLSEFGTDRPITEEEAKSENKPFNITVVIVLWKIKNKELCDFLLKESGEEGNNKLSLSFEVGFDKYQIIELSGDNSDFKSARKIIFEETPEFNSYDPVLKINGGSGKKNGNRVGRCLCGNVVPLGAGVVTTPAAAVKGILPITEKPEIIQDSIEANPFSPPSTHPYVVPANMKTLKLTDKQDKALKQKFANLSANTKVDVSLKNGKKIKLANYDNGTLSLPEDVDFEHDDIIDLDPSQVADNTHVDDSTIVHPRLGLEFPNVNKQTRELQEKNMEEQKELQKKAYKDASAALADLFDKLLKSQNFIEQNKNNSKNSVLKTNNDNNIMKIEKFNEVKASLEKATDLSTLKECAANAVLFADELAKESEKMVEALAAQKKLAEEAVKTKKDIEELHASMKKEFEALQKKMKDMEDSHKSEEANRKFQARMSHLESSYEMDDGCRAFIASDIKDLDDEEYASYEQKMEAFMKEKSKKYKNDLSEKLKAALSKKEEAEAIETEDMKAKHAKEEAEADMDEVMASAKNNPTDTDIKSKFIDNENKINDEAKSLKDRMKEAFGTDIKVGGFTVNQLKEQKKKQLESA